MSNAPQDPGPFSPAPALTTRVMHVNPASPEPDVIAQAAAVVQAGGLVAFPTETVYGLGANALDPTAVKRIFRAKGRPAADPLIVHVTSYDVLTTLTTLPLERLARLKHFWPGPLTVVVPKTALVPLEVTAGLDSVALRMPVHPVARALIDAAGTPIAAPSANAFTRPSPTEARHVLQDLNGRFELLLDGGPTEHGLESTVLDLTGDVPSLLRPGAVTVEALQAVFTDLALPAPQFLPDSVPLKSPGTHLKHYSPRAKVTLFSVASSEAGSEGVDALRAEVLESLKLGVKVGVLLSEESLLALAELPVELASLGEAARLEQAGARLFAGLRLLDERGVDVIYAVTFPEAGLGRTLNDRLRRAAEGRVRFV